MEKIIGRKKEIEILEKSNKNNTSELIAIYGRRRVGKTFLIRNYFEKQIIFEVVGLFNGNLNDQLQNFSKQLQKLGKKKIETPLNWLDAFTLLEQQLDKQTNKQKKVIFIDEFPWMATPRSKFLLAFENFWNQYATKRNDLIVVICGSAASYMVQKIIYNKGGLHNRITSKINLLPFTLNETKLFLKSRAIHYTNYDVLQIYMAIGGVPHYLNKLEKGKSTAQNIDDLCFQKEGALIDEFNQLYRSLFDNSEKHMQIIKALANTKKGITRNELVAKTGLESGGDLTLKLTELKESGFVSESSNYQNKKKGNLFRLSDEYSMFYLKFIEPNKTNGKGQWQRLMTSQSYKTWSGFSFEAVALKHIEEIKKALKIEAIYSTNSSWFNENAQIDLLIDRDDNVINVCEMKFYNGIYKIDKNNYLNLKNKIAELKQEIKTRKNLFLTLITSHGIAENKYSRELVSNSFDLDIFFDNKL